MAQGKNVLLCHVDGRVEAFDSLDDFSLDWGRKMRQQFLVERINWKRYEPDGNLFELQAGLIFNSQLDDLEAFKADTAHDLEDLERHLDVLTDPSILFAQAPQSHDAPLKQLHSQLPDWLQHASATDRFAYRQHLLDLAEVVAQSQDRTFNEGLDDIRTFSRHALRARMQADHGEAADYDPDDLELDFAVAAGYPGGAGFIEHVRMSLTDLALKNLVGKPNGRMSVSHKRGLALPAWLDEDYLLGSKGLIQRVDIGKVYPEKIKDLLLSGSPDAQRRALLYTRQLRVQLPMRALECKIRKQSGITAKGYRYVAALMGETPADRKVDEQDIVLRPLAFHRKPGAEPDVVDDMFVIEPKNLLAGPHVLYRPQYSESLIEFPSRSALLDAIAQAGDLQDSVLTWLPERARSVYANNGFNEPHILHFHLGDEFDRLPKPAPATLAGDEGADVLFQSLREGKILSALFGSNANALVDLANRESISNVESRWEILLKGAGLLFNVVLLPLVRGPLMLAGWMLVLIDGLEKDLSGLTSPDPETRELALIDLLLNTAMVLLHVTPAAGTPEHPLPRPTPDETALSLVPWRLAPHRPEPATLQIRLGTVSLPGEPVGGGHTPLDFISSIASPKATDKLLDALLNVHVPWPEKLPPAVTSGPFKGLYNIDGAWHASTGGLLFQVSIVPGFGEVYLIDPSHPDHPGFKLTSDGQGHWRLDRGLKLEGGGPKNRRQAKLEEIQRQLDEIKRNKPALEQQLERQMEQSARARAGLDETVSQFESTSLELEAAWEALDEAQEQEYQAAAVRHQQAVKAFADTNRAGNIQCELLIRITERVEQTTHELMDISRKSQPLELAVDHLRRQVDLLCGVAASYIYGLRFGLEVEKPTVTPQGEPIKVLFAREASELEEGIPTGYQEAVELFKSRLENKERSIDLVGRLDRLYSELDQFPAGRAEHERLAQLTDRPQVSDRMNAVISSLEMLRGLTLDRGKPMSAQEQYLSDLQLSDLKNEVTISYMNLRNTEGFTLAERQQVLSTVIDRYKLSLGACQDLLDTGSSPDRIDYQRRFVARINEVIANAEAEMAELIRSEAEVPAVQEVAKPQRKRSPTKRVFKTRNKGTLVGDQVPAPEGETGDFIEIRNPSNDQVVATFHKHPGEDVFVECVTLPPTKPKPVASAPSRSLATLRKDSQALIARRVDIEGSIRFQQRKLNDPTQLENLEPRDWDNMLTGHGEKLTALAREAEELNNPDAAALGKTLRDEAAQTVALARRYCAEGYKKQRPQAQKIDYLWRHGFVDINLVTRLKKLATGDYLTEYSIREKNSPNVLWYAHFHYPTLDTPRAAYSFAHIKIPTQRFLTYKDLLKQAGTDNPTVINLKKSVIEPPLDEKLFLKL
ncbi:dermonecrotic toxin domain-containing protein [Pseudomonas sp. A-RE-19]|uniref:dermonecrotic toxin domain-containing protein n=1 Tax=Pseudomonas sp. A-RE-19 TaxID=2832401 RepID=UPI001CBE4399|nr:DUF6543 domain-containing protein [Pseudomonas sp. A-RE-19]